jgi:hypothetical protein
MLIACLSQAHAQRSKKPFLYEKAAAAHLYEKAAAAHWIYSPVARMAAPRQSCWHTVFRSSCWLSGSAPARIRKDRAHEGPANSRSWLRTCGSLRLAGGCWRGAGYASHFECNAHHAFGLAIEFVAV